VTHYDGLAEAEHNARAIRHPRSTVPACPSCLRMMLRREAEEQGVCADCFRRLRGEPES
jgi:ribosomal protein L37AE/L43A